MLSDWGARASDIADELEDLRIDILQSDDEDSEEKADEIYYIIAELEEFISHEH